MGSVGTGWSDRERTTFAALLRVAAATSARSARHRGPVHDGRCPAWSAKPATRPVPAADGARRIRAGVRSP
ncbi:hypothetical protein [Streptomyces sp. Ncost-T10-10d]|uniref:hypothetical protein n=1 Tax=Streptomyces sp. Ncost-T10-10d TaxID=1839774 RepID=UPI003520E2AD